MQKMLALLQKVNEEENLFDQEVMDAIQYGECEDAYVVRAFEGPAELVIAKNDTFESQLAQFVHYVTWKNNQYKNDFPEDEQSPYARDWLSFKEEYNVIISIFYSLDLLSDYEKIFDYLISTLGKANYRAVRDARLIKKSNVLDLAESVFRYIGVTRAVRNLSKKYLDKNFGIQWEFHLWHMTPNDLIKDYGYIFYLGNELDSLAWCPFSYVAKEYYYNDFYNRLYENLFIDLPVYKKITEEERKAVRKEVWRVTHWTAKNNSFALMDEEDYEEEYEGYIYGYEDDMELDEE
ncbi:MAG: hypothetical protein PUH04_10590 [Firmicutes bacterium]|nr:hypothetical protein [Bacillota bacterium]